MAQMILCAIDDSEVAGRVLVTARGLADASGADLVAVHAVEEPGQDADHVLALVRDRLSATGVAAELRVVEGPPAEALIETAEREGAELLVIGSRGRGGLRSAVLGSVSRELASRAPCPVVIVPSGERWAETEVRADDANASVVCGVDGSDQALAAAALAGRLASRLRCRLVFVHARQNLRALAAYPGASKQTPPLTGQDDAVQKLAEKIIEDAEQVAGVSAVGVVEAGPPSEVLESVADREHARLIVIAARGVGGLRAALLGSVAADLPAAAARPIVVLSPPAAAAARSGS
ncbi:MAG TPA: universal stress protein [Solirubrobacteraceae bacterium]